MPIYGFSRCRVACSRDLQRCSLVFVDRYYDCGAVNDNHVVNWYFLGTTTTPRSETVKRSASRWRSWPICVPGGIFTYLSMMQFCRRAPAPTVTPSNNIDCSTSAPSPT